MTPENKALLFKRLKSFCWHGGTLGAVALLNFFASNLSLFNLPAWGVAILGVLAAQVTKELNNRLSA